MKGVTANVTPFATTYWTCAGAMARSPQYYATRQTILVDDDGDGIVRWELGRLKMVIGLFTMVDGTSGVVTTRSSANAAEVAPSAFPSKAFLRDANGTYSRFAMNVADLPAQRSSMPLLWVRHGVGAWSETATDSSFLDELVGTSSKVLLDVGTMKPIGSSPAAPSQVRAGDYFIMQDTQAAFWAGGLVDSHLGEASGGGVILHARTAGDEDAKKITFTLARIEGTDGTVSVHYETVDHSAQAGVHYQASAGDVVFQPGQIFSSFGVPVIDNSVTSEGTFKVNLSAASGASLGVSSIESYIRDNDSTPVVHFPHVSFPEGDGGLKEVSYVLPLNHTAPAPGTLHWEIRDRFDTSKVIDTGVLEYAVGEKDKALTTPYVADDVWGYPIRWSVYFTNFTNVSIGSRQGNLSIIEDDPAPTLTVPNVTVRESAGSATVTVHVSEPVSYSFGGLFETEDGTAKSPSDFEGWPTGKVFDYTEGSATATITIPIHNDTIAEGTESFDVLVYTIDGEDLLAATVTILDDDGPPKRRTMRH